MKKIVPPLLVLLSSCLLVIGEAQVGKPAPDFEVNDINGKTHKLSDYQGRIVVLEAYNLDCPYCANQFSSGAMQELQAKVAKKGVTWLLVNSTNKKSPSYRDPAAAKKEWAKQKIKAAAWIDDSDGKLGKAYGLKVTPHMIVIDKEGRIAYNGAIDDRPATSGDPRKARNYVAEAIDSLLAGKPVKVTRKKPYGCGIKYAK